MIRFYLVNVDRKLFSVAMKLLMDILEMLVGDVGIYLSGRNITVA